jgi:hypothetical protein
MIQNTGNRLGLLPVLALCLTVDCSQVSEQMGLTKEEDPLEKNLPTLALLAAFLPVNPGSCGFTFGSSSVSIQEYTLSANQSSSFPNGFTYAHRNWAAVKVPSVTATTTVAFTYSPYYPSSTYGSIYLVYNESACPLSNSSQIDWNRTADLTSARTPTNYTVSGNTISFNAAGAGKNFIIVSAGSPGSSPSVSRTN